MLNFRKLKHDFSPTILKDGKALYDKGMVVSTKIINLKPDLIRFSCRVMGSFDNCYESELEIDRHESVIIDSDCDCPYKYDCQHLAAVLFHLESHYNQILVAYSKETDLDKATHVDDQEKEHLRETFKEAETKEHARQDKKFQKELLEEYIYASQLLGQSSFFHPEEEIVQDKAELAVIFTAPQQKNLDQIEIQLALRLPFRSKSLNISQIKTFLDAVRYNEALYIGSKRYFFSLSSFDEASSQILKMVIDFARLPDNKSDKQQRTAFIDIEAFGTLLAVSYTLAEERFSSSAPLSEQESELYPMPCLYCGTIEEPLKLAMTPAALRFELDYLEVPAPKILLKPKIVLLNEAVITSEEALLFECAKPGMLYQNIYHRFQPNIKRKHLRNLPAIRNMTIPEPLFGTFVENALSELKRFADVSNKEIIERFVTLPFVERVGAECDIHYLNGELEASLCFVYGNVKVPAAASQLTVDHISTFVTPDGILARNLTEEQKIIDQLFQDFVYDPAQGLYSAKNEKKIVEFMTEVIPANQHRVKFNCPENLLDQFIYDDSTFILRLRETNRIDMYEVEIKVEGYLNGVTVDLLWDCLSSKRAFIELSTKKSGRRKAKAEEKKGLHKILVLDLEKLAPVVQIFDEMGINRLDDHVEQRPLWSLASLDVEQFQGLPIEFSMTAKLKEIQQQMLGQIPCISCEIPPVIQASLRNYQLDGIRWLDRLRNMHLNGILADDMGLGKTLQAITTLTQYKLDYPEQRSIVVCPTSLVYNWKEEFAKFNPNLKVLPVDGNPNQRKKLLSDIEDYDVIITSYTLLQKDIEFYKTIPFGYAILDEAQHIKNRGTRNAQSVKMIQAAHRLILTGTPIENSLEELWSLFDFLMPGLLSTYDRFVEKYIRHSPSLQSGKNLDNLRRKVAPFILRRMKKDVLDDLPPVSEIVYHCHLSDVQQELYRSYAASAREELSQLVKKEGFDRVQIHVLATLTRLKQICCHPAIFAKDRPENGDSAKYEMLLELLQTLMEGRHKTVIFSQYTRMLNIMREDLQKQGIRFEYLDGSSKNRLSIVKKFNEDQNIPIFLVSLKAGGSGLNLVGADTVIHYDMWWNPAVENQATDRVHRLGQKNSVSSYKLITLNTIEEKILELHKRKKSLVKEVVSRDEDMIAKLTWEEVLELLQT
ncbi:DEAD/DEAH box helicase [Candidatus Protochlamydia phocaeensis]|uniref:DEAD/DEAH box helicase n=1 Tax=Candidatus Protochlamydia phocaeensis TaxID=1414722 RepID=UPI000837B9CC|nr:DEAD/DEAH box helicase [Candidatus Protochlamydia phocaeensis]